MASSSGERAADSVELTDLPVPAAVVTSSKQNLVIQDADFEQNFDNRHEHQHVADIEDVPPNGGYGWVCTACVFFINANTWGVNSVSRFQSNRNQRLTIEGMGDLFGALPFLQYLPWRNTSRICSHWRTINLAESHGLTTRQHLNQPYWNQDHSPDRHLSSLCSTLQCRFSNQDMAALPLARPLLRLGNGLPLHHRDVCTPSLVRLKA